ncbi:DNA double-strand break repair nuclease NurA [Peptoniphilus catoniae]|uniref:DNA double-strand break repair nuclease NurA n=1 Tax=Peptoniphilus catoniae TaxID=1660341 RepID=UPI0010FED198|nr:DNA double-strand break repair nuclease NurA [Peptoniphilus catoniae]
MNNLNVMENEIRQLNSKLKSKYNNFFSMDKDNFRENILNKIGKFSTLKKLEAEELKNLGPVVGVDGSVNRVGGDFPHYVEIYQALAKPTRGEDLYLNECYTPLIDADEENEGSKREKLLAQIELDAAIESVKKHKPGILMMDGGLIRYKINDKDRYLELIDTCEENGVILIGVLKELKTNVISRALGEDTSIFDRELLYGKLNMGDFVEIYDELNKKFKENDKELVSGFLRASNSALAIGIDILASQRSYIKDAAELVYTLTPYNSRGVPLWLDIVDKEVKITDLLIKSMLEEYLDRDIYERFFITERDRR